MRLARRLRLERDGNDLTFNQLAALGTLRRHGPLTIGELAGARERQAAVDDPHRRLPRGAGLVTRRPSATDGRQVVVELTDRGRSRVLDEDRARRDAWLAQRLGELAPAERRAARARSPRCSNGWPATSSEPDVRRAEGPQLPPTSPPARCISNVGTWMQRVAQDWLVLALTGSAGALGITTGLQFLPILLFSPFAGVLADRYSKRHGPDVHAGDDGRRPPPSLGVLAVTGTVQPWHVYVLDVPVRHRHGGRHAGSPGVRQRDGRPRAPGQRRRPELGVVQPRPHDRPGARRPAHRVDGRGRRGDRLGHPAQRAPATRPWSSR